MKNFIRAATAVAASALSLVSCGGGATTPHLIGEMPVPNLPPNLVYDIGFVQNGRYYITDRTNKALDVFDVASLNNVAVVTGGFTGVYKDPVTGKVNNDRSGPDGVVGIPGSDTFYVGDVGKVVVVTGNKAVATIAIPDPSAAPSTTPSIFRSDEGCYDPDDKLMMFANPGDAVPFATWISTDTNTIVAQFPFGAAAGNSIGLEQCVYDAGSKTFFLNNDGSDTNAHGELVAFLASDVVAKAPKISKLFPEPDCNPTGLTLGPGKDILVSCVPDAGKPLKSLFFDRTAATGAAPVATVALAGGDQCTYDSVTNRYFMALRYWVDNGTSNGAGVTGQTYNPILGVIDASNHSIIAKVPAGKGDHSVAVDGAAHKVFVPHDAGSSTSAFPNPGISVFSTD